MVGLPAIAAAREDDGVPTARGGRWRASTVAHVLRSVAVDDALDTAHGELEAA